MEECVMTIDNSHDDEVPNLEMSTADEVGDIQNVPPSEFQASAPRRCFHVMATVATMESDSLLGAHPKKLDPDQELNRTFAEHQRQLDDWNVLGFNLAPRLTQALQWYRWLRNDELLPSHWKGIRLELPEYIRITFELRPAPEQGSYAFRRAPRDGTRWNININPTSIVEYRRSAAQTAATFCHNLLHLCEDQYLQQIGKRPCGSYHSMEFRRNARLIGIPCTRDGAEEGIVVGSRFERWLDQHSVARVFDYAEELDPEATRRKLPKRISWRCLCEDGVAVQVPRGSVIHARCELCSHLFKPGTLAELKQLGPKMRRIART